MSPCPQAKINELEATIRRFTSVAESYIEVLSQCRQDITKVQDLVGQQSRVTDPNRQNLLEILALLRAKNDKTLEKLSRLKELVKGEALKTASPIEVALKGKQYSIADKLVRSANKLEVLVEMLQGMEYHFGDQKHLARKVTLDHQAQNHAASNSENKVDRHVLEKLEVLTADSRRRRPGQKSDSVVPHPKHISNYRSPTVEDAEEDDGSDSLVDD